MTEKCMMCGKRPDNNLPMCTTCRLEMKDFEKLTSFLNGFDGDKRDASWLISSEIADRQSMVISHCKIVHDAEGTHLEAPAGRPYISRKLEEIDKLYRAKNILKNHYNI